MALFKHGRALLRSCNGVSRWTLVEQPWDGGRAILRQYIVKVCSRCNLQCDYCYIYTKADQRWRERPTTMSNPVVESFADRLAEHLVYEPAPVVDVILHGGEPLLFGATRLEHFVGTIEAAVGELSSVRFAVQTNGVLLDPSLLSTLNRLNIGIGVSVDGDLMAHDRHRRMLNGNGTYDEVRAALRLLSSVEFDHLFRGLLCTIDVRNDPLSTYESLLGYAPPNIDFLLPHSNWDELPIGRSGDAMTPYADWLIAVFERWYTAPHRETGVRLFESIMSCWLGGRSGVEGIGLELPSMVVVETDGSLELSDIVNSMSPGAASTGMNVLTHSFAEMLGSTSWLRYSANVARLPTPCQGCDVRTVCGGGLPAHRFGAGGFDHPSVHCADLFALIRHIGDRLLEDVGRLRSTS